MKLSLLLILPLLAISFASEDFDEDLSLSDDEGERELGGTPWYKQSFYLQKPPYKTSTGGSKCRKRTKRCCRCVDSCSSSSSDEEKKCVRKECKDKCKKAADKCYGSKKKWKVRDIVIVIVCVMCVSSSSAWSVIYTYTFFFHYFNNSRHFHHQYIRDRC